MYGKGRQGRHGTSLYSVIKGCLTQVELSAHLNSLSGLQERLGQSRSSEPSKQSLSWSHLHFIVKHLDKEEEEEEE